MSSPTTPRVVLGGVEVAMARAQGELDRVDDLIGSAEALNDTVASASRLAQRGLLRPVDQGHRLPGRHGPGAGSAACRARAS